MTLEDMLGTHTLTGVSYVVDRKLDKPTYFTTQTSAIYFTLDGVTYVAIEDSDDGYRSMLDDIQISDTAPLSSFETVEVTITWQKDKMHIIQMVDNANGKVILEIGTDYSDDYYPSFVANWMPQNLTVNEV